MKGLVAKIKHRMGLCHKARLGYRCHGRAGECR